MTTATTEHALEHAALCDFTTMLVYADYLEENGRTLESAESPRQDELSTHWWLRGDLWGPTRHHDGKPAGLYFSHILPRVWHSELLPHPGVHGKWKQSEAYPNRLQAFRAAVAAYARLTDAERAELLTWTWQSELDWLHAYERD
jgi:hypothetical protein